jgi:high-affinity iron transporter
VYASSLAAVFNIGVLTFREGLECILVLAAITASMTGPQRAGRRPVAVGAGFAFLATLATWAIVAGIVTQLADSVPALDIQAVTGLLAIFVLLLVMNWFFHKVYWSGWITMHNRKKKELFSAARAPASSRARLLWGLGLLGFTSLYREGFEVVLFLQSYKLQLGGRIVLEGVLAGLALTSIVAVLTFLAQQRLPYRRMLIVTGILLSAVLLVMVGEQAQEMQLAHWLPTTTIHALAGFIPRWVGLWFSVFPTVETLAAQLLAALLVFGSYIIARARVRAQSGMSEAGLRAG